MCSDAHGLFRTPGNTRSVGGHTKLMANPAFLTQYWYSGWVRTIFAYAFSEPVWLCRVRGCVLPETDCVTIRFPGSHPDAESRCRTLMDYIENHHLTVVGFSREIALIDNDLTQDSCKYVTCISIPIE